MSREGEAAREVAQGHGLALVALFGSRARGTAREGSDVDLGILSAGGEPLSLRALGAVKAAFEDRLGGAVDVVDLATADALLRFELISEARLLHAVPREAWTALVTRTLIEHDDIAPFLPAMIAGVHRAAREGAGR